MTKYIKYLGLKHDYDNVNCITLIDMIYVNELNNRIFTDVWKFFDIKKGHPEEKSRWSFRFSFEQLANWANKNTTKVDWQKDLQEYDVLWFKTKKNRPMHFGMYTGVNEFIHIEEGGYSRISFLNEEWRNQMFGAYRSKSEVVQ
jgi:hypothetical protein